LLHFLSQCLQFRHDLFHFHFQLVHARIGVGIPSGFRIAAFSFAPGPWRARLRVASSLTLSLRLPIHCA
jgi:hypothetical protein